MKGFLFISLLFISSLRAQDISYPLNLKSPEDDQVKIAVYREKCLAINAFIVKKSYPLDCFTNYHHYRSNALFKKNSSEVKIGSFNLLHPGTSKSLYKDNALIAKLINNYDVVASQELLATVGREEQHNKSVIAFLKLNGEALDKVKLERLKTKDVKKIKLLDAEIKQLVSDIEKAKSIYRAPGYLKILDELRKLDPSWSLLLSPRGDSALAGSVEELIGYFYRAGLATPVVNPHCKEKSKSKDDGIAVACFISLTKDFMGRDLEDHFARRPFMATFKIKNSKVTLVSSHMVFTYSGDESSEEDLMLKTFGVKNFRDLNSPGMTAITFARFAEVKNTLDFMEVYRKRYSDDRIMFVADTNLSASNPFWSDVLKSFPGGTLLIDQPTTLSPGRYNSQGIETEGIANDYDHFVLDKKTFPNCSNGEVFNYYKEKDFYSQLEKKYIIRQEVVGFYKPRYQLNTRFNEIEILDEDAEDSRVIEDENQPIEEEETSIKLDYPLTPAAQSKMDKFANIFELDLKKQLTIKKNLIVKDDFLIKERVDGLKRRVFLRQLTNPFYHRHMQEILSDHFPISITCQF